MIETGLWRGFISHDCSTNSALGFPGPRCWFTLCARRVGAAGSCRHPWEPELQGGAALPSVWPGRKLGLNVTRHGPVWGQGGVCRSVGCRGSRAPSRARAHGSPAFAGVWCTSPLASALWALLCRTAALSTAAEPRCLRSSGRTCSIWRGWGDCSKDEQRCRKLGLEGEILKFGHRVV